MRKHWDNLYWNEVAASQTLSEQFMRDFAYKLNWDLVLSRQKLSPEFKQEMKEYIDKWT